MPPLYAFILVVILCILSIIIFISIIHYIIQFKKYRSIEISIILLGILIITWFMSLIAVLIEPAMSLFT